MKKLLSILPIGSALASTTPTAAACKSKPKPPTVTQLDLSKLIITGIQVTKSTTTAKAGRLQINVTQAYNKIRLAIMNTYNVCGFQGGLLKTSDFKYGKATDKTHSWAIEIMDGNNKAFATLENNADIFTTQPTTQVLLPNNALEVKIVTTNTNVKAKTITTHAYLNKFVYSGKNINNGTEIFKTSPTTLPEAEPLENAIDISKDFDLTITDQTTAEDIIARVKTITGTSRTNASKKIINLLNEQLKKETKILADLGVLLPTGTVDFNASSNFAIYRLTPGTSNPLIPAEVAKIEGTHTAAEGNLIFVRLQNLGLNHYIGNLHSYLYLQLGTVVAHS